MLTVFYPADLSQSSSMTPLLPLEITTTKFRNRKRKSKEPSQQETRADYFDATSEVIEPSTRADYYDATSDVIKPSTEPLIDLLPSHDTSLSSNDENDTWQDEQNLTNQVSFISSFHQWACF